MAKLIRLLKDQPPHSPFILMCTKGLRTPGFDLRSVWILNQRMPKWRLSW